MLMKEQHDRLRQEYEGKLADLERERETIVEEKAQVDRYKQLLLKQRDIMIALTQRLVERDEQIVSLQDELDAYDKHHKELEEKLDEKTALLIKFQRIAMEVNAKSPYKNEELTKALESWKNENQNRGMSNASATELSVVDDEDASVENGRSTPPSGLSNTYSDISGGSTNTRIEDMLRREWSACLRRIRKDEGGRSGTSSSAAVNHMSDMMSSVLRNIRRQEADSANGPTHSDSGRGNYEELVAENKRLSAKLREYVSNGTSENPPHEEHAMVKRQCEVLIKERQAVHTIMEQKIKVLVQSVAQAVGVVLHGAQGGGTTGHALAKDVAALQRLVNASIAALRNAASSGASSQQKPTTSSSSASGSSAQQSGVPQRSASAGRLSTSTTASGGLYRPPGSSQRMHPDESGGKYEQYPVQSIRAAPAPSRTGTDRVDSVRSSLDRVKAGLWASSPSSDNAVRASADTARARGGSTQQPPQRAAPSAQSRNLSGKAEDLYNRTRTKYASMAEL